MHKRKKTKAATFDGKRSRKSAVKPEPGAPTTAAATAPPLSAPTTAAAAAPEPGTPTAAAPPLSAPDVIIQSSAAPKPAKKAGVIIWDIHVDTAGSFIKFDDPAREPGSDMQLTSTDGKVYHFLKAYIPKKDPQNSLAIAMAGDPEEKEYNMDADSEVTGILLNWWCAGRERRLKCVTDSFAAHGFAEEMELMRKLALAAHQYTIPELETYACETILKKVVPMEKDYELFRKIHRSTIGLIDSWVVEVSSRMDKLLPVNYIMSDDFLRDCLYGSNGKMRVKYENEHRLAIRALCMVCATSADAITNFQARKFLQLVHYHMQGAGRFYTLSSDFVKYFGEAREKLVDKPYAARLDQIFWDTALQIPQGW